MAIVQKQQLRSYRRAVQAGDQCPCSTAVEVRLQSGVQVKELGRLSAEWFEEHLNRPSTRQPKLPGLLISKRQLDEVRHLGGQRDLCLLDHVRIYATTDSHGAKDFPSLSDPHFCPLLARGRSYGVDQYGKGDTPMQGAKLFKLLEEFVHEISTKHPAPPNWRGN